MLFLIDLNTIKPPYFLLHSKFSYISFLSQNIYVFMILNFRTYGFSYSQLNSAILSDFDPVFAYLMTNKHNTLVSKYFSYLNFPTRKTISLSERKLIIITAYSKSRVVWTISKIKNKKWHSLFFPQVLMIIWINN